MKTDRVEGPVGKGRLQSEEKQYAAVIPQGHESRGPGLSQSQCFMNLLCLKLFQLSAAVLLWERREIMQLNCHVATDILSKMCLGVLLKHLFAPVIRVGTVREIKVFTVSYARVWKRSKCRTPRLETELQNTNPV